MNIYNSTKVLPYVYMCKEKNSPYFYIGYRYANYDPSTKDFGKKYFTSNNYVRENFDNFEHTIIAEFFTKEDAYAYESQLIQELNSEYLINSQRYKKCKPYQKVIVDNSPKICALPGCDKEFTNWRVQCCCRSHQQKFSGMRAHNKFTVLV